jgi:excisionase family DNA binding protein
MFTVKEVAERFRVGDASVLQWIHDGLIKAIQVNRKSGAKKPHWRIPQSAIDAFEAIRTPTAPAPRARRRKAHTGVVEFYK